MIDRGEALAVDRACRWLGPVDEALEVSGFEASVPDALPAGLTAADE